jgi:multidrug efflux pump subunit AcrA (membrane-fusion protein)
MSEPTIVGYRFRPAPGWDPAPEGAPDDWFPPEDWAPPAHWPPAPEGWDFREPIYADAKPEVAPDESHPEANDSASYQPLTPLSARTVPGLGTKKFAVGLLAEIEQWHSFAEGLNRANFEKDQQLASLGALTAAELAGEEARLRDSVAEISGQRDSIRAQVDEASASLADVRDRLELASDGLYAYQHPAETSLELQTRLSIVQNQIKDMVRGKTAVTTSATFTFNGSAVEGRRWVGDISKLMLRAFNAEAENCVKTVRAGNLAAAQKRLATSVDQIAKLGARMGIAIAPAYERLRMEELQLAAEYQERVKQERENERERKAELREAERAERELKAQRERLERERQQYLNAIERLVAQGDTEAADRTRAELARVDGEIESVDRRVANVRIGHVYVISNIGAFGERMVKIGMTRRLEPKDRIRELGDASVPFRFDTHALIFSEDAVGLETKLHQALATRRVNQVNLRREFFYATPHEVKELIREVTADFQELVEFNEHADADEYRVSAGAPDTET